MQPREIAKFTSFTVRAETSDVNMCTTKFVIIYDILQLRVNQALPECENLDFSLGSGTDRNKKRLIFYSLSPLSPFYMDVETLIANSPHLKKCFFNLEISFCKLKLSL